MASPHRGALSAEMIAMVSRGKSCFISAARRFEGRSGPGETGRIIPVPAVCRWRSAMRSTSLKVVALPCIKRPRGQPVSGRDAELVLRGE